MDIAGLDPGDYFWRVRAIDDKNKVSDASDSYKFTLVAQGKEQEMLLEVDDTELQGNVVEVIGRTEPGAALIINGEQVADIQPDGHFRYFTEPMARGSHSDRHHRAEPPGRNGHQARAGGNSVAIGSSQPPASAAAAALN